MMVWRKMIVVVWGAAAGVCSVAGGAEAQPKPNVVVIVGDDLGYADVGVQGISTDVRTPHIDSIAKGGVRFTQGYVSCPVCSPTRAGLLTGRYQQRFGHEFNPGGNSPGAFGMPLDQVTIGDVMRKAGYRTGLMGKWHQGNREGYRPNERGFDEFYGFHGGAHPYENIAEDKVGTNAIMRDKEAVGEKEYLTDAISREAVGFVERNQGRPFFLYVAFNAVHTPQEAPAKYVERFAGVKDQKRKMMLAMLSAMDDGVGEILGKIREKGLEERTLVFFITDNGGPTEGNGSRNTPLAGQKGRVAEGGIRVPFLAQWKGRVPAGRVLEQPVIALDIFATSVGVAGAEGPKDRVMDGVDLMPLMEGKTEKRPHERLYWRYGQQRAIREGDWKLVKLLGEGEKLFDLSKDVGETKDLAGERPEVAERLRGEYAEWEKGLVAPKWELVPRGQRRGAGARGRQGGVE